MAFPKAKQGALTSHITVPMKDEHAQAFREAAGRQRRPVSASAREILLATIGIEDVAP